jgi:hypothetical protein
VNETDSEQMPGPEMNVSDLVRDVAYHDPHFDVTDGLTYIRQRSRNRDLGLANMHEARQPCRADGKGTAEL